MFVFRVFNNITESWTRAQAEASSRDRDHNFDHDAPSFWEINEADARYRTDFIAVLCAVAAITWALAVSLWAIRRREPVDAPPVRTQPVRSTPSDAIVTNTDRVRAELLRALATSDSDLCALYDADLTPVACLHRLTMHGFDYLPGLVPEMSVDKMESILDAAELFDTRATGELAEFRDFAGDVIDNVRSQKTELIRRYDAYRAGRNARLANPLPDPRTRAIRTCK